MALVETSYTTLCWCYGNICSFDHFSSFIFFLSLSRFSIKFLRHCFLGWILFTVSTPQNETNWLPTKQTNKQQKTHERIKLYIGVGLQPNEWWIHSNHIERANITNIKTCRAIVTAWVVIVLTGIPAALTHGVVNYPYGGRNYTACLFLSDEGYNLVAFQVRIFLFSFVFIHKTLHSEAYGIDGWKKITTNISSTLIWPIFWWLKSFSEYRFVI